MLSIIIPTLNEENRISQIISFCLNSPLVHEVIVIDDGSTDSTFQRAKAAGAKVYFSSMLGKGTSMLDGLWKAQSDIVLYLDGDIFNFSEDIIEKIARPLISNECDFVKGKFHRTAGRVTALTAKPLLKAFFPELCEIDQPLGGIVGAKKDLLKNIKFEADYGVDIGLLIDVHQLGARVREVDIGSLDHDHQSLEQLSQMSVQIVRVILDKAARYKKLDIMHLKDTYEIQRVNQLQIEPILAKIDPQKKLAMFDMDGTLIEGRYVERLARYANRSEQLMRLLDNSKLDPIYRTRMIAKVLTGLPKSVFEKIANIIPLAKNAQQMVVELKKRGYTVGIVTDSYFVASEIIRKRVFADFSIAHLLEFKKGAFTGEIQISPMMISNQCLKHEYCKSNILGHINQFFDIERSMLHFAGDGLNDICLLKSVGKSVAVRPKHKDVAKSSDVSIEDLSEILSYWR